MRLMVLCVLDLNEASAPKRDWRQNKANGAEAYANRNAWNQRQHLLLIARRHPDGESVAILIDSFRPYFWLAFKAGSLQTHAQREAIRNTLMGRFKADGVECGSDEWNGSPKRCIYEQFTGPIDAVRVYARNKMHRDALRKQLTEEYGDDALYEHKGIDVPLQFMVHCAVAPCGWVEIDGQLIDCSPMRQVSKCAKEYRIAHHSQIRSLSGDTAREATPPSDMPSLLDSVLPLRMLWFDIEAVDRRGMFPHPDHAETIMLSTVSVQGANIVRRRVYHLRKCAAPPEELQCEFIECVGERDLLLRFADEVQQFDADFIGGFNSSGFDLPFVFERAKKLGIFDRFGSSLSRLREVKASMRRMVKETKQKGRRESFLIAFHGRFGYDLLEVIRGEYSKLRSYTLNNISKHFLNDQKEDVHHSVIPKLYNGSDEQRRRLAVYCLKDSVLLHDLDRHLTMQTRYVEMCRVTGVDFGALVERGQQIKVVSQILRAARERHMLVPLKRERAVTGYTPEGKFDGGAVLEPQTGFYSTKRPVMVLDFASLYPSVEKGRNTSYETLIPIEKVRDYEPHQYWRSPSGHCFLRASEPVGVGIIPSILTNLLDARKRTKQAMKKETDAERRGVLDARQLALKISANSVYGFTGVSQSSGGMLPLFECSESTTAWGRESLYRVRDYIEQTYGESDGAKVIYGDTDSVFVCMDSCQTVEAAYERMQLLGEEITRELFADMPPMKLEAEKVFSPMVLVNKKRYGGLKYEKSARKEDATVAYTGIETVRRENCELVSETIDAACRALFVDDDVEASKQRIRDTVRSLYVRQAPLSKLLLTKSLSRDPDKYAGPQPHAELTKEMRSRDIGSAPRVGDRVIYLMVNKGDGKVASMAEDPLYVLEHELAPNVDFYINQLRGPIDRIFTPVIGEEAVAELFTGEHTRQRNLKARKGEQSRGIMAFFTVQRKCTLCQSVMKDAAGGSICAECRKRRASQVQEHEEQRRERARDAVEAYERIYKSCQQCQGDGDDAEVLCMARDCAQLYVRSELKKRRDEAVRDIEDLV